MLKQMMPVSVLWILKIKKEKVSTHQWLKIPQLMDYNVLLVISSSILSRVKWVSLVFPMVPSRRVKLSHWLILIRKQERDVSENYSSLIILERKKLTTLLPVKLSCLVDSKESKLVIL